MSTGHELEPVPEESRLAPPGAVPGPSQGAADLASAVGNRAFTRSVALREQPDGPTVQRMIPLALIGAGLIYVSGEKRGWWGDHPEAKAADPTERLSQIKEERAAHERTRRTLNNQVTPTIDMAASLVRGGTPEGATKAVNYTRPLFQVLPTLAVGDGQRKHLEVAQDQFGEGLQTAAALTETRDESIAMAKKQNESAIAALRSVVSGTAAPAPQAPAPQGAAPQGPAPQAPAPQGPAPAAPAPGPAPEQGAPGPPPPPIPADVIGSLKAAAETLEVANKELDGLGETGNPADVLKLTEDIEPQLSSLAAGVIGPQHETIERAGFLVRNGVRHLRALTRTREQNGAHAADSFIKSRQTLQEMFDALLRGDKALEEEEQKLRAQQTAGGAPPADGGAK